MHDNRTPPLAKAITARPSRRAVLAAAPIAAAAVLTGAPLASAATSSVAADPGPQMRTRAQGLLASLDPTLGARAVFPFEGRQRRAWNFMLGSRRAPGVALEEMSDDQKTAALDLLATALGQEGMVKAERIMLQQDILRDEWGKGSPDRNRERFSIQFYGAPSATDPWSWRWEGHHLSLTFTLVGDQVVSVTPMSFSSEPNTVPSGPHQGMVVLQEEAIGRRIFGDLSPAHRERALFRESAPGNIMTTAGRESRLEGERAGVPLADLPTAQADEIVRLVEVFTVDPLVPVLADRERTRVHGGDLMGAHFAWAGSDRGEGPIYYRVQGDGFLVEFATLRNQPLHHHAVRHDLTRNFGDHTL